MRLRVPDYFKDFSCIADRCKDSCCIGWEIDIDPDTYEYYHEVEGEFGERLRANMKARDETSFVLNKGRCPFLNGQNLCDICTTLGETALCEICTEYPRVTLEYGDIREKCLGLSCEEVGRILFTRHEKITFEETVLPYDYEADTYELTASLERVRDHAIHIMQDRKYAISDRIALVLEFAEAVQKDINECELAHDKEVILAFQGDALSRMCQKNQSSSEKVDHRELFEQRLKRFCALEILDQEWLSAIRRIKVLFKEITSTEYEIWTKEFLNYYKEREYEYEHLMVYFIFRYGMKSAYDNNFLSKIKLAVASVLMIRDMDVERFLANGRQYTLADRIDIARIYSKEVEHSEENLESLEEDFMFEEVFTTEKLKNTII